MGMKIFENVCPCLKDFKNIPLLKIINPYMVL